MLLTTVKGNIVERTKCACGKTSDGEPRARSTSNEVNQETHAEIRCLDLSLPTRTQAHNPLTQIHSHLEISILSME